MPPYLLLDGVLDIEVDGTVLAELGRARCSASGALLGGGRRALAGGADVLLHDAQFSASQRQTADAYGHPTIDDATAFAERCEVRHLVLTNHAPNRTDDEPDTMAGCVAIQGTVLAMR